MKYFRFKIIEKSTKTNIFEITKGVLVELKLT